MSFSSLINKRTFSGNGLTTEWPFSYPIVSSDGSEIEVWLTSPAGVTTETTNFTIDVSAAKVTYPTVVVPATDPLPTGWKLTLLRVNPLTQLLDLITQGSFNAEVIETAFDKVTQICQQLKEEIDRSIKVGLTEDAATSDVLIAQINTAVTAAELAEVNAETSETNAGVSEINAAASAREAASYELLSNVYLPDYNEADQGLTGDGKSAKAYIDSIGADGATLVFRHNSGSAITTYTFSTDETIPSNINVIIEKGAILSIDNTFTLTVNGSFDAGFYQVFSGDGSVIFGSTAIKEVYPQWWTPNAIPGTTDMASALQSALDSLPSTGGIVKLTELMGVGSVGWVGIAKDNISNISIIGQGWSTGLKLLVIPSQDIVTDYFPIIKFGGATGVNGVKVSNFKIDLNNLLSSGIGFQKSSDGKISNMEITNSPVGAAGSPQRALILVQGHRNKVLDNYVHHVSSGISFGVVGGSYYEALSELRGNKFENSYQTTESYLYGGIIEDNIWQDSGYLTDDVTPSHGGNIVAIEVGGRPALSMKYWSFSNNIIAHSRAGGLQVSPAGSGELVDGGIISNNTIKLCGASAIYTFADVSNLNIIGNLCVDNVKGITITRNGNGGGSNILIANNNCSDTRTGVNRTQERGITIGASDAIADDFIDIIIKNNILHNNTQYGLYLEGATVNAGKNILIEGNIANDNSNYGILIDEGYDGVIISNNITLGNTTADIRTKHVTNYATVLLNNRYDNLLSAESKTFHVGNRISNVADCYIVTPKASFANQFTFSAKNAPAQITADQNDYEPSGLSTANILRLNSDAARTITGIATGSDGRILIIYNYGAQNIVLAESSAASIVANRILTGVGNFTITPGMSVMLIYEAGGEKWRLFN